MNKPFFLTPYDLLKTIALLLMVVDHIGAYFYPENIELRAIGRLCVPIWLFLIGYARSRTLDRKLIGCAAFLTVLDYVALGYFHGLNILWTIILLRLTLDPLNDWFGRSLTKLICFTVVCFVLAPVSRMVVDYGTMAYALAFWGFFTRRHTTYQTVGPLFPLFYGIAALTMFIIVETMAFGFNFSQIALLVVGGFIVIHPLMVDLPRNEPVDWPNVPVVIRRSLSFLGRHTLEFYTLHLSVIFLLFILNCRLGLIGGFTCPKLGP